MPRVIRFPDLGRTVTVGDDITDDGIEEIHSELSRQQLRSKQGQARAEGMEAQTKADVLDAYENDPEMPALMRSELARRVASGMANIAGSSMSAASMLLPGETSKKLNAYGKEISKLGDIASTAPSSISEIEDVGDAAGYAGRLVAEQIPQLLLSGATGGALKLAGVGSKAAAIAAPVITTFPQEAGSIYQDITDQTGETGLRQRAAAIGGGALSAGLEAFGAEGRILKNLGKGGVGSLRKVGAEILKSSAGEGLTEAGQESISMLSSAAGGGDTPTAREFGRRALEAGAGGAIAGGLMGGASSFVEQAGSPGVYAAALQDRLNPQEEVDKTGAYIARDSEGNAIRYGSGRNVIRDGTGRVISGINAAGGLEPYTGARIEQDRPAAFRANPNDIDSLALSDRMAAARVNALNQRQAQLTAEADAARAANDSVRLQEALQEQALIDLEIARAEAEAARAQRRAEDQKRAEERRSSRAAVEQGLTSESGQTYDIAEPEPTRPSINTTSGLAQRTNRDDIRTPFDEYMMNRAPALLNLPKPIADLYDGVRGIIKSFQENASKEGANFDRDLTADLAKQAPVISQQLKRRIEGAITDGVSAKEIVPLIELSQQLDAFPADFKAYQELTADAMAEGRKGAQARRVTSALSPLEQQMQGRVGRSGSSTARGSTSPSFTSAMFGIADRLRAARLEDERLAAEARAKAAADAARPKISPPTESSLPADAGAAPVGGVPVATPALVSNVTEKQTPAASPAPTVKPTKTKAPRRAANAPTTQAQGVADANQVQGPVEVPSGNQPQGSSQDAGRQAGAVQVAAGTQQQGQPSAPTYQGGADVKVGDYVQVKGLSGAGNTVIKGAVVAIRDGKPVVSLDQVGVGGANAATRNGYAPKQERVIEGGATISPSKRIEKAEPKKRGRKPKLGLNEKAAIQERLNKASQTKEYLDYSTLRELSDKGDTDAKQKLDALVAQLSATEEGATFLREIIAAHEESLASTVIDRASYGLGGVRLNNALDEYTRLIYEWLNNPEKPRFSRRNFAKKALLKEFVTRPEIARQRYLKSKEGKTSVDKDSQELESDAVAQQVENNVDDDEESSDNPESFRISNQIDENIDDDGNTRVKERALTEADSAVDDSLNPAEDISRTEIRSVIDALPYRIRGAIYEAEKKNGGKMPKTSEITEILSKELVSVVGMISDGALDVVAKDRIKKWAAAHASKISKAARMDRFSEVHDLITNLFSNKNYTGSNGRTLSLGEMTLSDAIDYVLDTNSPDNLLRTMAQKLLKAGVKARVVILSDEDFNLLGAPEGEVAFYDSNPAGNSIYIRQSAAGHDYIVMHEAIHAATVNALRTNVSFRNEIGRLRAAAINALGDSYYGLKDHGNNFTNLAEFIAEGFTNAKFRQQLEVISDGKQGLWTKIKNSIAKLFGFDVNERSLLDALADTASNEFAQNTARPNQADAAYMGLVSRYESGDQSVLPELQRMVDGAAKAAGYSLTGYHTTDKQFDSFDPERSTVWGEFWFSPENNSGEMGADRANTIRAFINPGRIGNGFQALRDRRVRLLNDNTSVRGDQARDVLSDYPYDTVVLNNFSGAGSRSGKAFVVFSPSQIKSAEVITRDQNGNVIPLSQRFNPESNSILFAAKPYTSAQEVIDALKVPDALGQEAIMQSARATQQLVPREVADEVRNSILSDDFRDLLEGIEGEQNPSARKKLIKDAKDLGFNYFDWLRSPERIADRQIKGILDIADLTEEEGITISAIDDLRMKREASFVVDRTARRIEETKRKNEIKKDKLSEQAQNPKDPLNQELARLSTLEGMIATTSEDAIQSYRDYLSDLNETARMGGPSVNEQVVSVATAAQRLGTMTNQIGDAIDTVASKLTPDEVKSAKSNEELIKMISDKGLLSGSKILNLLIPANGTPGLLQKYAGLKASLLHIQELHKNQSEVASRISAAQAEFAVAVGRKNAGKITLQDFARAYTRMMNRIGEIAVVNRKIARRNKAITVSSLIATALDTVTSSEEYKAQWNEAVTEQDMRVFGINGRDEGNEHIIELGIDPKDQSKLEQFRFMNTVNRPADAAKNAETYAKLLSKIDGMLEDPATSPALRNALLQKKLELEVERDDRVEGSLALSPFDALAYFRRLPFVKSFLTANLPAWLMNGQLGKRIRGIQDAIDRMSGQIKDLRNNATYGRRAIVLASAEAMKSHAEEMPANLTRKQQEEWWVENVLEEVLSQNQNIKEDSLKPGQFTRKNIQVTKEDLKAAELMAKWNDSLRKIIESMPGIAKFFPTRIIEVINGVTYSRLSYATSSLTVPRLLNRMITDSGDSNSPMDIVNKWAKATTLEEKIALLNNPDVFDTLALSHVAELNSEYRRISKFEQRYKQLARGWRKTGSYPTTIDELVDQIGEIDEDGESAEEARTEVLTELIGEIDKFTSSLSKQAKETARENEARMNSLVGDAKRSELSVLIELDGENAFTRPRLEMVAPSSFYRHELATAQSFGALQRGALIPLTLQQVELYSQYKRKLESAIIDLEQQRDPGSWTAFTKELVAASKGDIYNTKREMQLLLDQINVVESALKDSLNVRPASSESRGFASRMMDLIKSQMLASVTSLARNMFTGVAFSRAFADTALKGHRLVAPVRATKHVLGAIKDISLYAFANSPSIANWVEKNKDGPLRFILQDLANAAQQILIAKNYLGVDGHSLKQDIAFRALGDSAFARNQFGQGASSRLADAFLSMAGVRHLTAVLPKIVDIQERITNTLSVKYFDEELRRYFYNLSKIIDGRVKSGKPGALDFSKPENRFTAKELASVGISPTTWARQLKLFNTTKTIEQLAMDYYNRLQEAKAKGQNWTLVSFTEDEGIYGDMIDALGKLNNLSALSNRPAITRARTQFGDLAREAVLFPGFANGYLSTLQLMQMVHTAQEIPKRNAEAFSQMLMLIAVLLAIGIPTAELSKWVYRVYYGRPYPAETFSDLRNGEITPERLARISGAALATTIPYLGEYIASAMGAQNYKAAATDLANMSLPLKLATAAYDSAKSFAQTKDAGGAAISVARNFTPGLTPLINRLPAVQARNAAADAVRVAKVNRGELEVSERGGGGYGGQQTEFGSVINRALAASAAGDTATAKSLLDRATKIKADAGDANPQASVRNAIQSRRPEYKAFGRKLSDDEKTALLGRMSTGQREIFSKADDAATRLLEITPTKTQMTQGGGGPIERLNKRLSSIKKMSQPKALKDLKKRIKAVKSRTKVASVKKLKLASTKAASGSRLLRPKAQGKAASALLPAV